MSAESPVPQPETQGIKEKQGRFSTILRVAQRIGAVALGTDSPTKGLDQIKGLGFSSTPTNLEEPLTPKPLTPYIDINTGKPADPSIFTSKPTS